MDIQKHIHDGLISLRVTPNSCRTELIEEEGKLKLYLKAVPEDNKANLELIKFFKKELGVKVKIQCGDHSRDKLLQVLSS